jgi:hypothetical protein
MDRTEANDQLLQQTTEIQDKTLESLLRTQRLIAQSTEVGAQTLEELHKQGAQLDEINAELDNVSTQLDKADQLQNKFDWWAGNWFGGKKAKAIREAHKEIAASHKIPDPLAEKVREVFENEKYDGLTRTWKPVGIFLCSSPTTPAKDIFDPKRNSGADSKNTWVIDYSLNGIDSEGWTYAFDNATLIKNGVGESSMKWNSYVRRRKWVLDEKKTSAASTGTGIAA